jgi:hypothetical protein
MRTSLTASVIAILAAVGLSHARQQEVQRSISGSDFLLLHAIVLTVSKKESKFDPSMFNIVITEDATEYFVTFEPLQWKSGTWVGSPPGEALEVIVEKKRRTVRTWYWTMARER